MLGTKNDEILTCLLLIVVGYTIAKMFSKRYEGFSLCPTDSHTPTRNPADSCIAHYTDCEKLYTHTIGSESPYAVHTCKKGGLINGNRCISSGNKCVFSDGHPCTENADCLNSSCVNSKCISKPPSPPPPSCPSGQSYCMNQNICVDKCRSGQELSSQCICLPKCCSKQTCTDPHECDP